MFYLDSQTNTRYRIGTPFTYNGKQYTKAGATHETFMSLGFTQVIIQQRPDDRFYVVSGPDNTGAYTATERDLAELKTSYVRETKLNAFRLLKATDWYVVRQTELGYSEAPVPVDITTFRAAVRSVSDVRCGQIEGVTSVSDLEALIKAPSYLYDEEGNETGVNPAALTVFPEQPDEVTTYG
jgi:hypothetical protein